MDVFPAFKLGGWLICGSRYTGKYMVINSMNMQHCPWPMYHHANQLQLLPYTMTDTIWHWFEQYYTVFQKIVTFYFCDYTVKCWPILIIFGVIIVEEICNKSIFTKYGIA